MHFLAPCQKAKIFVSKPLSHEYGTFILKWLVRSITTDACCARWTAGSAFFKLLLQLPHCFPQVFLGRIIIAYFDQAGNLHLQKILVFKENKL